MRPYISGKEVEPGRDEAACMRLTNSKWIQSGHIVHVNSNRSGDKSRDKTKDVDFL